MGPSGYELDKLIDLDRVQRLCDSLSQAFDVTLAVLDLSGNVLIATGWQEICTRFHREHPETLRGCLESDLLINTRLVQGLDEREHYAYRCSNGLWDVAFPLVVGGEHVANVYTGQFFFEDDEVDREAFADRARRLGFDVDAYLEALDRVPVITQARLQKTIGFLSDFVGMLGELGLTRHAARAEARAAAGERAAVPAPVRQRRGRPHRLPRRARRRRRARGPRHRRRQPHPGAADQGPRRATGRVASQRVRRQRRATARLLRRGGRRSRGRAGRPAARCTCGRTGPTSCSRRIRWPTTCGWCRRPMSPTCARPSGRCAGRKRASGWPTSTCWTR